MKRKTLILILSCEAVFFAVLTVLTTQIPNIFSSVIAFPFEQIADGLSAISKAGRWGNGIAAALWVGISAIPAMIALRYDRDKKTLLERISLFLLSGVMLLAFYGMVNPRFFSLLVSEGLPGTTKIIKSVFGVSVWATVILYIVLRLIRLFRRGSKEQLFKYMRTILCVLCIIITAFAVNSLTNGIVSLFEPSQTGADRGFGVFCFAAEIVPYLFDIAVIIQGMELLDIAAREEQDGIAEAAKRLSDICCLALGITTAITAVTDVIQIFVMRWLSNASFTANIPIIDITFVVMILLFSRLLIDNKRLRDDNNLFI